MRASNVSHAAYFAFLCASNILPVPDEHKAYRAMMDVLTEKNFFKKLRELEELEDGQ